MKKFITASTAGFVYLMPVFAFAQSSVQAEELSSYSASIIGFINDVILPLILAIAFLVFIWGIFKFFILGASDEEERGKGKQLMIWGIIGFVVIITIVGIITLLANATGLTAGSGGTLPTPFIPIN